MSEADMVACITNVGSDGFCELPFGGLHSPVIERLLNEWTDDHNKVNIMRTISLSLIIETRHVFSFRFCI